ncbi:MULTISPECIES: NAD(P)H-dependent glycerol-3-phosphate dehydrogenase [unclassified Pedobacter]|uniref:NAD(P)H-dependent glycerol-3-phosphate dehydrogenase n=1 Tax=unclassified Pedobacter TaxID=2628915 RepID=UPI0017EE400B|nr:MULTISPECIES: NAD(P)H-dependent glycerol-3-phosphate dehydrogenase [unclassified Pedobacter]NII85505.1 glycerol-3-phosphate dehydrogenase (NAD(P)+) [Pedobacter sp. SG908]NMN39578.1 glycerol-3-phosphate dehydrogenase (NAD(P)+) [Pedobacter sp. SG918]
MVPKIAMIGGGSWATAIVKMLADNLAEKEIFWWMRNETAIEHIKKFRHNPNYISSVEIKLDEDDHISSDINSIIKSADFVILNVPAAFLKTTLSSITPEDLKGKKIVSAIKGIVPEDNLIIGEFMHEKYGIPYHDILVVSGPCHAEEVALEKLSYLTIACTNVEQASTFASFLNTRYIKTNVSDDIFGTEYAAVLKNIYAVASGICHGIGYGDNFQAVLISNAIREIKRFVDIVHPITRDIMESAYLGDLLVTAYSQFSRNRTFGNMVGKGYTVKSAQLEMNMIAEGYYAVKCMHIKNQAYNVDMPICKAVHSIIYENRSPHIEMKLLAEKLN